MMQPPPAPLFSMNDSFSVPPDIEEDADMDVLQATQEATQQDEPFVAPNLDHLWGILIPCNASMTKIELLKTTPEYLIGRHQDCAIRFTGQKISNKHCILRWDEHSKGVTIVDMSTNGTYLNGERLIRGQAQFIAQGQELSFGPPMSQGGAGQDYRYIFTLVSGRTQKQGVFSQYDFGPELGRGSFASVHLAVHYATGLKYAIKLISKARFQMSPSAVKMFMRETEILQALDHPNIVTVKEIFEDEETIAIVMELVQGGDLLDHILNCDGLVEEDAKHLAYHMCSAIAYLHEKGIAHRDLKPENVLLVKGNPPTAKIADFGLAKAVDSGTFLKTMCGTPSYLAPEVVSRVESTGYDLLVDSWSVGVIVFSMLTNSSPFVEDSRIPMIERVAKRSVEWSYLQSARVSPACLDFVKRLLTNDPQHRMSMSEALNHRWFTGKPAPAPPPPLVITSAMGEMRQTGVESQRSTASPPPPEEATRDSSMLFVGQTGGDAEVYSQDFQKLKLGTVESLQSKFSEDSILSGSKPRAADSIFVSRARRARQKAEMSVVADSQPQNGNGAGEESWVDVPTPVNPPLELTPPAASAPPSATHEQNGKNSAPHSKSNHANGSATPKTAQKRKAELDLNFSSDGLSEPPSDEDYDADGSKIVTPAAATKGRKGAKVAPAPKVTRGKAAANAANRTRSARLKSVPEDGETPPLRRSGRRPGHTKARRLS